MLVTLQCVCHWHCGNCDNTELPSCCCCAWMWTCVVDTKDCVAINNHRVAIQYNTGIHYTSCLLLYFVVHINMWKHVNNQILTILFPQQLFQDHGELLLSCTGADSGAVRGARIPSCNNSVSTHHHVTPFIQCTEKWLKKWKEIMYTKHYYRVYIRNVIVCHDL